MSCIHANVFVQFRTEKIKISSLRLIMRVKGQTSSDTAEHSMGVSEQTHRPVAVTSADKQHKSKLSRDADCHFVSALL